MTRNAWSSLMRNSPFSTVTTNSRGVKSSLTRMTLKSFGRSVFGLTLVWGVVTILGIVCTRIAEAILPIFAQSGVMVHALGTALHGWELRLTGCWTDCRLTEAVIPSPTFDSG